MPPNLAAWLAFIHTFPHPRRDLRPPDQKSFKETHGIAAVIEVIPVGMINEACERTLKNDVRSRFVIDIASLK
jgi:hypothetical protein